MTDPITNLIDTYHELNASVVDELDEEPSALEFMRYVAKNRPFVVRGAATDWQAFEKWDADYLQNTMAGEDVRVAVTPLGNADAVVIQDDGSLVMAEPYEVFEPFPRFLDTVRGPSSDSAADPDHVRYAQTQNDNLRNEYANLYSDVPADISFARIALGQKADAINLWLGNDRSTTALHKDNYENVYVQIRGQKHFVLMPPVEMPCVNEQMVRKGRYVPTGTSASTSHEQDDNNALHQDGALEIQLDKQSDLVPAATWDPDMHLERTTAYSHLAKPLRVTLREGNMLYLPSMWYHKVSQSVGEEGFVCAVNYWYDMAFDGQHWASSAFVRDVYDEQQRRPAYPALDVNSEQ